jgi:hypothetical protein
MDVYLAQAGSWVTVIEGCIFVVCVLTFRQGIVGVVAPYVTGRLLPPSGPGRDTPPPDLSETPHKEPETIGGSF